MAYDIDNSKKLCYKLCLKLFHYDDISNGATNFVRSHAYWFLWKAMLQIMLEIILFHYVNAYVIDVTIDYYYTHILIRNMAREGWDNILIS